jgi:hypothetical protein
MLPSMVRRVWPLLLLLASCREEPTPARAMELPPPAVTPASFVADPEPPPCVAEPIAGELYETPPGVDLEPTGEHVEAVLSELERRHPCHARREQIGSSHEGRPIWALQVGNLARDDAPSFLLDGATHGDEPLSITFVLDAARHLLERRGRDAVVDRLLEEASFLLVPLVNPDGLVIHQAEARRLGRDPGTADGRSPGRKNARDNDRDDRIGPNDGVDINRNYPFKWGFLGEEGSTSAYALRIYRGPEAGSEPETRAMMALADREVFAGAMSFHVGAVTVLVPYTIERVRDPKPNEAWDVARSIVAIKRRHPSVMGPTFPMQRNLYAVDGTDQDWLRHRHGTLAYIVEGAVRGTPLDRRGAAVQAVRELWLNLASRVLDGPSIVGRVVDAEGQPVAAEVHLAGADFKEKESWRARCRDGRFVRVVTEPGTHTLVVRHDGQEIEREIEVTGRAEIEIRLPTRVADRCPS